MAIKSVVSLDKLEARLREYEEKYGVESSRLETAFRASPLRETDDFHDWTLLYSAYLAGKKRLLSA